jgi:hypothetical protein
MLVHSDDNAWLQVGVVKRAEWPEAGIVCILQTKSQARRGGFEIRHSQMPSGRRRVELAALFSFREHRGLMQDQAWETVDGFVSGQGFTVWAFIRTWLECCVQWHVDHSCGRKISSHTSSGAEQLLDVLRGGRSRRRVTAGEPGADLAEKILQPAGVTVTTIRPASRRCS